jgi:hypothetical protein
LQDKLRRKAVELIGDRGQMLADCLDNLDRLTAHDIGMLIAGE